MASNPASPTTATAGCAVDSGSEAIFAGDCIVSGDLAWDFGAECCFTVAFGVESGGCSDTFAFGVGPDASFNTVTFGVESDGCSDQVWPISAQIVEDQT